VWIVGAAGVVVAASARIRFSTELERDTEEIAEILLLKAAAGGHDHRAVMLALIEEDDRIVEALRRRGENEPP
jgi:hypothetical protein